MLFRRKETPWEVVDSKRVDPIPLFDELDDDDLDVLRIADLDMRATFTHEIRDISDMRRVVHTTRHLLMQTVAGHHYNMLLSEGWTVTVLRRGKTYKAEVTYRGRPAYVAGKVKSRPPPPFMEVLDHCKHEIDTPILGITVQEVKKRTKMQRVHRLSLPLPLPKRIRK